MSNMPLIFFKSKQTYHIYFEHEHETYNRNWASNHEHHTYTIVYSTKLESSRRRAVHTFQDYTLRVHDMYTESTVAKTVLDSYQSFEIHTGFRLKVTELREFVVDTAL